MKFVLTLTLIVHMTSCVASQSSPNSQSLKVSDIGNIQLVDSDNNTYAIYTKDKKIYIPLHLNEKFRKGGLKVIFEGIIDTSRLQNVRLAGIPIRIIKIKAK
jgi:hypothetical protein